MRPILQVFMFLSVFVTFNFCAYGVFAKSWPTKRPHIVMIVADDMGINDVSYNGANQIPTPNIDALAYNGIILKRHYVPPICTPSRTSLLTGRYAIRTGMQGSPMKAGEPRGIPLNVTLMPQRFLELGYETRLVGKWHVGYPSEDFTPARRGFESFFGYYNGLLGYYDNTIIQEMPGGKNITGFDLHRDGPDELTEVRDSKYFTDLITDEAEKIIKANGNSKPLFLEVAHLAVHTTSREDNPLEVRNETETEETFHYIKDDMRRKYAGMMKALDESVGRVVAALSEAKMLDNSIIVFMSDNGAPTFGMYGNTGSNYPLRGIKSTLFEGGVRTAAFVFSSLIKSNSRVSEQPIHVTDWLPTLYAAAGADVSDLGEIDGLNQWPSLTRATRSPRQSMLLNIDEVEGTEAVIGGRFKLIKGAKDETEGYYGETGNDPSYPAYSVDEVMMSTAGQTIRRLEGFAGPTAERAQKMRENSILRCNNPTANGHSNCSRLCLFDLLHDPCETRDVSKRYPKVVKDLEAMLNEYRAVMVPQTNTDVDPCSNPRYFNGWWMPWRTENGSEVAAQCHSNIQQQLEKFF